MKATKSTETVNIVVAKEYEYVTLKLSKEEAILLYCLVGSLEKRVAKETVRLSIERYNCSHKHLLNNLDSRVCCLMGDLYDALGDSTK